MNQKELVDGGFKIYRNRIKHYRKIRTFQNSNKNSTSKNGKNAWRYTNDRMTRKENNFAAKYRNEEKLTDKPNK